MGATKVNPRSNDAVRPPDVTLTSTAPATVTVGVTAVIASVLWTETLLAAVPPIVTAASLENPLPLMVTAVPPRELPVAGETAAIARVGSVGPVGDSPHAANSNDATSEGATTANRRR